MYRHRLAIRLIPVYAALAILLAPLGMHTFARHSIEVEAKAANASLSSKTNQSKIRGVPVRIVVPDKAIDLKIVKGSYSNTAKSWSVSPDSANYAVNTAAVNNQQGQTLIYGHNSRNVFGPLLSLAPGAEVFVYTDNQHIFKYRYVSAADISPATDIFGQMAKAEPGLKLITCNGAYFQYRHFMSLELVGAS
jgi:sortase (surface protein transpeptidase)